MKDFIGLSTVAMMTIFGLWIGQHETPKQEMFTAVILIVISTIMIAISLKALSPESEA